MYLVGLRIYYKMIHGPYSIKLHINTFSSFIRNPYIRGNFYLYLEYECRYYS